MHCRQLSCSKTSAWTTSGPDLSWWRCSWYGPCPSVWGDAASIGMLFRQSPCKLRTGVLGTALYGRTLILEVSLGTVIVVATILIGELTESKAPSHQWVWRHMLVPLALDWVPARSSRVNMLATAQKCAVNSEFSPYVENHACKVVWK